MPTYTVSSDDFTSIKLNETDPVASVLQNVAVILSTLQGDVPLGRDIGLKGNFIDKPMPIAKTLMMAEIQEAIITQEPRASLMDVTFEEDQDTPGRLNPTVTVEVKNGK